MMRTNCYRDAVPVDDKEILELYDNLSGVDRLRLDPREKMFPAVFQYGANWILLFKNIHSNLASGGCNEIRERYL